VSQLKPLNFRGVTACLCLLMTLSAISLLELAWPAPPVPAQLTVAEVAEDLYLLQQKLLRHSAFLALRGEPTAAQLQQASQALLNKMDGQLSSGRFAGELLQLLTPLGDPGLRLAPGLLNCRQLPLQLRPMDHHWLALDAKGNALDADMPFITHIDGLPLPRWIDAARRYLPLSAKQSDGLLLPWLGRLGILRRDLGLPNPDSVLLGLSDGEFGSRNLSLPLPPEPQIAAEPQYAATWLDDYPRLKPLLQPLMGPLLQTLHLNGLQSWPKPLSANQVQGSQTIASKAQAGAIPSPVIDQSPQLERLDEQSMKLTLANLDALDAPANKHLLQRAMTAPLLLLDLRHGHGHSPQLLSLLADYMGVSDELLGFAHYRRGDTRSDFFGSEAFRILPGQLEMTAQPGSDAFGPGFSRTLNRSAANRVAVRAAAHSVAPITGGVRLAIVTGPDCRQECEWIVHSAKHWPNTVILGEATSGDLGKLYQLTLPNSRIRIAFSQSLAFDAEGQLLSATGTAPDISISSVDEPDWQGLLQLIGAEQLSRSNSSHGTAAR